MQIWSMRSSDNKFNCIWYLITFKLLLYLISYSFYFTYIRSGKFTYSYTLLHFACLFLVLIEITNYDMIYTVTVINILKYTKLSIWEYIQKPIWIASIEKLDFMNSK